MDESNPAPQTEDHPAGLFCCKYHSRHVIGVVVRRSHVRRLLVFARSLHLEDLEVGNLPTALEDDRVKDEFTGSGRVKCSICGRVSEWHVRDDGLREAFRQRSRVHPAYQGR